MSRVIVTKSSSWIHTCWMLVALASAPLVLAAAPAGTATLTRDARDARWLEGKIRVAAAPAEVVERVARVDRWNQLFSDVKSVRVVKRSPNHWHVRLDTRTMDCGEHDYHITVRPGQGITLVIDAPGIEARGSLSARASERIGQSEITFRLFIDTKGVMGWFIPESTLRARQQQMVRRDLEDLARSFALGLKLPTMEPTSHGDTLAELVPILRGLRRGGVPSAPARLDDG
jgi:hypothetical protein